MTSAALKKERADEARSYRRQVFALLEAGPGTMHELAERGGMTNQQVLTAVRALQRSGVVLGRGEGIYELWAHVTARMVARERSAPRGPERAVRAERGRVVA